MKDETAPPASAESALSFVAGIAGAAVLTPVGLYLVYALTGGVRVSPRAIGFDLSFSSIPMACFMALGLVEWVWLLPLILLLRRRGRPELAKGLLAGGAIIALLNAGGWGLAGLLFRAHR